MHTLVCQREACKKTFESHKADQKYCCYECRDEDKRKVPRPDCDELRRVANLPGSRNGSGEANWSALGRHFKVDPKTVRKWAEQLGCDDL